MYNLFSIKSEVNCILLLLRVYIILTQPVTYVCCFIIYLS